MEKLFNIKYKPKEIDNFELDDSLKYLFKNLIEMDNISLMLIGNSGSGKSSLINVLISEYYKDISEEQKNNNLMTINTLREQGIQYYRNEVKIFCQIPSSIPKKKKIIILDDIDLINEQSQQVFRNCMDKYLHNVHFICSCINTQKVIESIQSRIITIKLKPFSKDNIRTILNKIKIEEEIDIDDDAEEKILNISNNSIRILINYMEKFKLLDQKITSEKVDELCTNINFHDFTNYIKLCQSKHLEKAVDLIMNIYNSGFSVIDILDNLFVYVKYSDGLDEQYKYELIKLLCKYITIFHNIHEDEIELCLFTNNVINIFV